MNHHLLLVCFSLALTAHYCTTVELCISSCGNTCMDTLFMCACDSDCGRYRDCCGPSSLSPPSTCPPSLLAPLEPGVTVECTSTFAVPGVRVRGSNEAFQMVTSCPDSWPANTLATDGTNTVLANCVSPNLPLPPVTDTEEGMVYKNEYCAICNGVMQIQAWQVAIAYTRSVYAALLRSTIPEILAEDPDIFTTMCQPCSYQPPSPPSLPSPPSPVYPCYTLVPEPS